MNAIYTNCNPALIKSILKDLPKDQFMAHANYIKETFEALPPGNRKLMFSRLLSFCKFHYNNRFSDELDFDFYYPFR